MQRPDHLNRPPSFMSCATLARELDISESTVHEMVRRGVLPHPVKLSSGCVRWSWVDVQRALGAMTPASASGDVDPYLMGVQNATRP